MLPGKPAFRMKDSPMKIEAVVATLNEAFRLDPAAMDEIICRRVACNQSIKNHPTILPWRHPTEEGAEPQLTLGFLGILNGILKGQGIDDRIAYQFPEYWPQTNSLSVANPEVAGFVITDKNGKVR
jgi:hypothetical protein